MGGGRRRPAGLHRCLHSPEMATEGGEGGAEANWRRRDPLGGLGEAGELQDERDAGVDAGGRIRPSPGWAWCKRRRGSCGQP